MKKPKLHYFPMAFVSDHTYPRKIAGWRCKEWCFQILVLTKLTIGSTEEQNYSRNLQENSGENWKYWKFKKKNKKKPTTFQNWKYWKAAAEVIITFRRMQTLCLSGANKQQLPYTKLSQTKPPGQAAGKRSLRKTHTLPSASKPALLWNIWEHSSESTHPQAQYLLEFITGAKLERFRLHCDFVTSENKQVLLEDWIICHVDAYWNSPSVHLYWNSDTSLAQ